MANAKKGSKKVDVYEHPDGVIFIQPTTRLPNGRHRTKQDVIIYANVKDSKETLGNKIWEALEKCD